jgi:hypothetical protein
MARYSGHGGYGVFVWVNSSSVTVYTVVHNITYELRGELKAPEHTDSRDQGWASGLGKVATAEVTLECNDDDTAAMDFVGVPMGQRGDLYMRRGELERFDAITTTTWMGLPGRTNDNMEGGTPRVRYRFMYGILTTWVAKASLPAGLRSYLQGLTPPLLTP